MRNARSLLACLMISSAALLGCSDDTDPPQDGGGPDGLWPCDPPGMACNPHDDCAINPICGEDGYCHPSGRQDCNDGLDCTEDSCGGSGICNNEPKEGTCAIRVQAAGGSEVQCFDKDELHPDDPCKICDPESDPLDWSPRTGGTCDDGNLCTKDDYCQSGICVGTDYADKCADGLSCTTDICDGKGRCGTPQLRADACLIDGVCYMKDEQDEDGCNTCDPDTSQTAWTPLKAHCLIDGHCYLPNEEDSTGCAKCDLNNPDEWTPLAGKCKIGSICKSASDTHAEGCAVCDPDENPNGWTVPAAENKCLIDDSCYDDGADDGTGCAECDPATDKYAWTPVQGKCKIGEECMDEGELDESGCFKCDLANPSSWTLVDTAQGTTENFDASGDLPSGWTEEHSDSGDKVKWQVVDKRAHSGSNSLYYGDPVAGNYDTGTENNGTATLSGVVLEANKKAALTFWVWLSVEGMSSYDVAAISVVEGGNTTLVWDKDQLSYDEEEVWTEQIVDLSAWAGKTIELEFSFDTVDDFNNDYEGVYFDDISIYSGC